MNTASKSIPKRLIVIAAGCKAAVLHAGKDQKKIQTFLCAAGFHHGRYRLHCVTLFYRNFERYIASEIPCDKVPCSHLLSYRKVGSTSPFRGIIQTTFSNAKRQRKFLEKISEKYKMRLTA